MPTRVRGPKTSRATQQRMNNATRPTIANLIATTPTETNAATTPTAVPTSAANAANNIRSGRPIRNSTSSTGSASRPSTAMIGSPMTASRMPIGISTTRATAPKNRARITPNMFELPGSRYGKRGLAAAHAGSIPSIASAASVAASGRAGGGGVSLTGREAAPGSSPRRRHTTLISFPATIQTSQIGRTTNNANLSAATDNTASSGSPMTLRIIAIGTSNPSQPSLKNQRSAISRSAIHRIADHMPFRLVEQDGEAYGDAPQKVSRASSRSVGAISRPTKNSPKSAYFALTSSKRMSVTSFLKSSGSLAKRVTPHSQTSNPTAPVMICSTRPAYRRPVKPCAYMSRLRSSSESVYQFCVASRRLDIG